MLSRLRSYRPNHVAVVAYLSLFLVLTGGSAVALTGTNTVFSDDIAPGEVKTADLGSNAVKSGKVPANALTGNDVTGLSSGDVNDNSLTGADVNESTFGQVPSAQNAGNAGALDGKDSSAFLQAGGAAGGDLTGTFPNPQIADDAVGSGEVEDRTLRLPDVAAAHGGASINFDTISAGTCVSQDTPLAGVTIGDIPIVVSPASVDDRLVPHANPNSGNLGKVPWQLCNVGETDINPPEATYQFVVFRG